MTSLECFYYYLQLKASPTPARTNSSQASGAGFQGMNVGGAWPMAALNTDTVIPGVGTAPGPQGVTSVAQSAGGPTWPSAPPSRPSLTQRGCACRCIAWRRGGQAPAAQRCRSRWSLRHVTATVDEQDKTSRHPPPPRMAPHYPPPTALCPCVLVPSPHLEQTWDGYPPLLRTPD